MARWGLGLYRGGAYLFVGCVLFAACEGSSQERAAPETEEIAAGPSPVASEGESQKVAEPPLAPPTSQGTVLAGRELGMVVTGMQTGGPNRSLEVLEGQLLAFLSQLQEVYERERAQDPELMGSLDVSLTITPEGTISDLRFPRTRVSSEKLVAAVFDRMRTWTFPPAEGRVQLRYTLLFVPPGIDHTSIFTWEKHLASRLVIDRSGEEHTAVVTAPVPEPVKSPAPKVVAAAPVKPVKRPTPPSPPRPETAKRREEPTVLGWYRVIRSSALYAAPRAAADIITQLRPGTRVRVVRVVNGEWLEVHSVSNRPPGFLRRSNAQPVAESSSARAGSQF